MICTGLNRLFLFGTVVALFLEGCFSLNTAFASADKSVAEGWEIVDRDLAEDWEVVQENSHRMEEFELLGNLHRSNPTPFEQVFSRDFEAVNNGRDESVFRGSRTMTLLGMAAACSEEAFRQTGDDKRRQTGMIVPVFMTWYILKNNLCQAEVDRLSKKGFESFALERIESSLGNKSQDPKALAKYTRGMIKDILKSLESSLTFHDLQKILNP